MDSPDRPQIIQVQYYAKNCCGKPSISKDVMESGL